MARTDFLDTDRVLVTNRNGTSFRGLLSQLVTYIESFLRPYKVYAALLSQNGTSSPPTAITLENTIGPVVLSRDGDGVYYITKVGAFTEGKTYVVCGTYYEGEIGTNIFIGAIWYGPDDIQVTTGNGTTGIDGVLQLTSIEIRVYN